MWGAGEGVKSLEGCKYFNFLGVLMDHGFEYNLDGNKLKVYSILEKNSWLIFGQMFVN